MSCLLTATGRWVRALLERFVTAIENADASALAEMLAEDVALEMPAQLAWFTGRQINHAARGDSAGSGWSISARRRQAARNMPQPEEQT
jgi:ketosteroid isomerase-like protein